MRSVYSLVLAFGLVALGMPRATASAETVNVTIASVTVAPSTIQQTDTVSLSTSVTSFSSLANVIVDFEVLDSANNSVYQTCLTGIDLTANAQRSFSVPWLVPAGLPAGTYQLRTGAINAWWSYTYAWSDTAAAISVEGTSTSISIVSGSVTPATLAPSGTASLAAVVGSTAALSGALVDFEIYDGQNNRVFQTYQSGIALAANAQQTVTALWTVPPSQPGGIYLLRVGVFDGTWSYRYAWLSPAASFTITAPPPAGPPGSSAVAFGVEIPGDLWNPSVIDSFTAMVGTAPKIVMWYQDWVSDSGFHLASMQAYAARGEVPVVTWLPDAAGSLLNFDAAVASGSYDGFLHQWAQAAAAWGHPFYLRFAPEMNGPWEGFSPGVNGNTTADYVAMWRHVHDLFVQDGAVNVRWVWCPNIDSYGSTPYAAVYPGDAYVDWVGFDGYNWGHYDQWHWWTSLHDVFALSYADLTALTSKPIMIGETASTEIGGDKAAWITEGFLNDIPAYFPRVRAVIWFDEDKEVDWRVNSSQSSLAAFQQVAASPLYQGQLP